MRSVLLCSLLVIVLGIAEFPYIRFRALRPKGLEICVDDLPKINQFYFEGDVYKDNLKNETIIGGVFSRRDNKTWCWKNETLYLELGDAIRYVARGTVDDEERKVDTSKIITVYDVVNDDFDAHKTTTTTTTVPTTSSTTEIISSTESEISHPVVHPSVETEEDHFLHSPETSIENEETTYTVAAKEVHVIEEKVQCNETTLKHVKRMEILLDEIKKSRNAQENEIERLKQDLAKETKDYEVLAKMYSKKAKGNNNYLLLKKLLGVLPREDPSTFLRDFLREKLNLCNGELGVKFVEKVNQTILFRVNDYENKIKVLIAAYEILDDSKYTVVDSVYEINSVIRSINIRRSGITTPRPNHQNYIPGYEDNQFFT